MTFPKRYILSNLQRKQFLEIINTIRPPGHRPTWKSKRKSPTETKKAKEKLSNLQRRGIQPPKS